METILNILRAIIAFLVITGVAMLFIIVVIDMWNKKPPSGGLMA